MMEITSEEKARMFAGGDYPDSVMCCPYCGGNYLHGSGHVKSAPGADWRASYGVKFWCEYCPKIFMLWFVNDKGNTHMMLERLWDEERVAEVEQARCEDEYKKLEEKKEESPSGSKHSTWIYRLEKK